MALICGDIGGTKAWLALAEVEGNRVRFLFRQRYECVGFADFSGLFACFRDEAPDVPVTGGCLALAGPVEDDGMTAHITNLPWTVDARECGAVFGLPPLRLANDFAGAAAGIAAVAGEDLVTLQAGEPLADGVRLVVGAGTGLGMALLVKDGERWRPLPGEGGHVGFSPQNPIEARIHTALLQEYGRVTWERVVSGPGLAAIHRVLAGEEREPASIAAAAMAGEGSALHALRVFLAAYGAYAGDMAMATQARGGVFLAGGIAGKVLPVLRSSGDFLAAFNAKAQHARLLARVPVHVVTDELLGLKGAALLAAA